MRNFLWTMKWLVNGMVWESLGFGRRDGFTGIILNISFFDATEEGGHSHSPEKFTNYLWRWFQVRGVEFFSLRNSLWVVSARASCKFVLPKEMSPFFLWIGKL